MRSDAIDPATLDLPHGVATRAEWLAGGASARMFRDGRLVAVTTQIYAMPRVLVEPLDVVRLVGRLAPDGAVITGWAAALIHGVRDAGPTLLHATGTPIQICLARDDNRSPNGFGTLRVALDDDDVDTVDGLPVTSVARTAYDMARFARTTAEAVAVIDAFRCELNPRPLDLRHIDERIERRPRGRGHPRLRKAVALSTSRSRSIAESELRTRMVTTLDLDPARVLSNPVLGLGPRDWELDLVDLDSGLVLECDSEFHAGTEQRERDALKDLEVGEAGLGMVRVNARTRAKPDRELAAFLRRAQATAYRKGARERCRQLLDGGYLTEPPLRDYRRTA